MMFMFEGERRRIDGFEGKKPSKLESFGGK